MRVAFFFPSIIVAIFILSSCQSVSASDRGCVTTCCKNCSGEPFCSLCRRLHSDREGCKCVSDSEEALRHSGDRLSQLRETASDEEVYDIKTSEDVKKSKKIPKCRPSCCPRSDCTKVTCPSCYARMRRVPSLCPCVDIQQTEETHMSQQQSHDDIQEDNISSVQNTLTDITDDEDDGVTQVSTPRLVPLCRPSCCPRADCTKLTCPSCYARMRRTPDLCPCVNTGQLKLIFIFVFDSFFFQDNFQNESIRFDDVRRDVSILSVDAS